MSLENTHLAESSVGEFSILKYVKSETLVNLWLTAYFEKRIKKKQLMSINIDESVQEIIKITNSENEWIPLRISCGLLTGVVKLFCHKVEYLDNKCTTVFTRMQNFSKNLHNSNNLNSSKVNNKEGLNPKIDRPQNHSKQLKSVIDIDYINRTLNINDNSIDQLEMVPLSQLTERSENQNLELTLSQRSDQNLNQTGDSMPILLDMEFDDFINNEENEDADVEMMIEDRLIVNESGVEIDLEANIEKRRGASVDFGEILANGIEEIGSIERGKLSEHGSNGDLLDIDNSHEYRGSINTFRESPISGSNRDSIGGFSAVLETIEDSGNRLSISEVSESILNKDSILDNISAFNLPEISKSIKVSEAYSGRVGTKRMKVIEIARDIVTSSRPLENGDNSLSTAFSNSKSDLKILKNLINLNKNSEMGVLCLNKTLPIRLSGGFLMKFISNEGPRVKNIRKGTIHKNNKSSFVSDSVKRSPNLSIEASPSFENFEYRPEQEIYTNSVYEELNPDEEFQTNTPVRGKKLQSQEDCDEKDELTFTPWTNYFGTTQKNIIGLSPNTYYDDEKKIQSLFSSREVKTMEYLNSKFSKSDILTFDELVKGSDSSVVAPIFVQILHLKSKSMIDIHQEEPFGKISIFPVVNNAHKIT
ncbi:N terminus of Rad21 / Rec8 like protein family protein [Cryptosporidium meleagridis]|uniref:N terminus of Rad21 / Rec8 like protein family protein n=1 Tax=Cryptosporidium meleagridis TaxID=93969 RepID=A0A2P4Z2E9_9CRYT|nr:N terminus of Rad21 / Rec8 like protein family protein [Cryptosporidium meleagridis]